MIETVSLFVCVRVLVSVDKMFQNFVHCSWILMKLDFDENACQQALTIGRSYQLNETV